MQYGQMPCLTAQRFDGPAGIDEAGERHMHQDLVNGFKNMIEAIKNDSRCTGAWHYGSVGRGQSDQYSDYDPVFLVPDRYFEEFSKDVRHFVGKACDEILISWAEDYNSEYFKNFCNLIRIKENLHQLDFFILNEDKTDNWWCRQHLKGCTRDNIIYDTDGRVGELLDKGLRTYNFNPDPLRCFDTYWFHVEMLIKYFKRGDLFKIIKNMDFLVQSHVNLLLAEYDTLDWGAWETKVKKCVPSDKQLHLLAYYTHPDLDSYKKAVVKGFEHFHRDAQAIFKNKGLHYKEHVATAVMDFFVRELSPSQAPSL
jgi:predicted nucleotidyltransferase